MVKGRKEKEKLTEPDGRDGRLHYVLVPLLDVCLSLAAACVLLLYELGVPPALLEGLGHGVYIEV
ncbi:hypothetical protein F4824DRAFT_466052 [Ustulina deusta]|nr:hypothetical protein F4824DRAFT_466052 [Ustulina deusta]